MFLRKLFLLLLMLSAGAAQTKDSTLMKNLQSRYVRTIRSADTAVAKIVVQSFTVLSQYEQKIKVKELLTSPFITQLFDHDLHRSPEQHVSDSVRSVQYLMLLHLYTTLFNQYIKTAESFLNDLIGAKKYWFYEDFYMNQSLLRRHPVYSLYSSAYAKNVACKVAIIEELEGQVAHMLGMCLYGIHKIDSIEREDQIVAILLDATAPLYAMYNAPFPVEEISHDPSVLFHDLLWMYEAMDENMSHVKQVLQENNKPPFAVQHWFGLSCAAATVLAAYVVYKKNEEEIPRLQAKSIASAQYIWNDYVVVPTTDLVDVLWYNQGKKIKKIKRLPRMEEQKLPSIPRIEEQDYGLTTWFVDSCVNKLVRPYWNTLLDWFENISNITVNQRSRSFVDQLATSLESSADDVVDQVNDLVMKNQQVNLALAAIGPVLLVAYLGGKYAKAGYNRFIKHDNWYAPMKYSLRAADQLINSVACSNHHSFIDDGKLYMLVMNVKQYIACLDNEELILMHKDLEDLLSFDLTYEQKHGVIERMYRTYNFLK